MKPTSLLFLAVCTCIIPSHAAELKLARVFSQNTVLQRDRAVPVWGWAEPGAKVTVEFARQRKATTADASGRWLVKLDPLPANAARHPYWFRRHPRSPSRSPAW